MWAIILSLVTCLPKNARIHSPELKVNTFNAGEVSLAEQKGKVVILDFWATWCPPCRMEIPGFIDIKKSYPDSLVQIIGIALERNPNKVQEFMKKMGINYPIAMGSREIVSKFGNIQAIPTTFVIDPEGNICQRYVGYTPKDKFINDIERLLRERNSKKTVKKNVKKKSAKD